MVVFRALLDLLTPPSCLVCEAPLSGSGLCFACLRQAERVTAPCPTCSGAEADPRRIPCELCRVVVPGIPLRHAGWHRGSLRDLVLAAKWQSFTAAIPLLADWMLEAAAREHWLSGIRTWCAVPRDPWRTLVHGVPLSEHLGQEIGRRRGWKRVPPPRRVRRAPQAGLLGDVRKKNLQGAFRVRERHRKRLEGRRVLLIDDVFTTGATLVECAAALQSAGAREVKGLVVTVAPLRV